MDWINKKIQRWKLKRELKSLTKFKNDFEAHQSRYEQTGISAIRIINLSYNKTCERIKEIANPLT